MKKIIEWSHRYLDEMNLMDVALLKYCLFAFGILFGMKLQDKSKKIVTPIATGVFATTYIHLIVKAFRILKDMIEDKS